MKSILSLFLGLVVFCFLSSCSKKVPDGVIVSTPTPVLEIDTLTDMGIFEGPYYKKFVNIDFRNTGDTLLHILKVIPECDCTEVSVNDTILPPGAVGTITAYLDLSDYPFGENRKQFAILSDSRGKKVTYVTLIGTKN